MRRTNVAQDADLDTELAKRSSTHHDQIEAALQAFALGISVFGISVLRFSIELSIPGDLELVGTARSPTPNHDEELI